MAARQQSPTPQHGAAPACAGQAAGGAGAPDALLIGKQYVGQIRAPRMFSGASAPPGVLLFSCPHPGAGCAVIAVGPPSKKNLEITVTGKSVATAQSGPEVQAALRLLGLENNQQPVMFLKHEGRRCGTKPSCTPKPPAGPSDCSRLPLRCPASCFSGNLRHKKLVQLVA